MNCGNINAKDGNFGAGIGGGYDSDCGTITIKNTVTKVTATKGAYAKHSIGVGYLRTCGTVTIGDNVGEIEQSPYPYEP